MTKDLSISVIVATANRSFELERLLYSLSTQTLLADRVIIVDASDDEFSKNIVEKLQNLFQLQIIYIKSPHKSLTYQRNLGISHNHSDLILFLDDDVVLRNNYLFEMNKIFSEDEDERIGGVGGIIKGSRRYLSDNLMYLCGTLLHKPGSVSVIGMPSSIIDNFFFTPSEVMFLNGCDMMYRRKIFEKLFFSEFYSGYGFGEDLEFSYRVSKRWKLVVNPRAICEHIRSMNGRPNFVEYGRQWIRNQHYMFMVNIEKKNIFIWTLYLWSRFITILYNFFPILVHPSVAKEKILIIYGHLLGLYQIVIGFWNCEYSTYLIKTQKKI